MAYRVWRVESEPIIVTTITEPVDWEADARGALVEVNRLTAQIEGEVYRIADLSGVKATFSDLVQGLAAVTRSEGGWLSAPGQRPIVVTSQQITALFADFAQQDQYGKLAVDVFPTLDAALAHVWGRIAGDDQ